jgi:broad specificity phosphatase PhoE
MSTIYLVRHGDKESRIGNPGLSPKGCHQAQQTAHWFQLKSIQSIVTSPIERTKQTAKYIADACALPLVCNDQLRERLNWGDDPNMSFETFISTWKHTQQDRSWYPPIGDSSQATGLRMQQAIVAATQHVQHVVCVSHGGSIADLLCTLFPHLDLVETEHHISECSITTLEYSDPNHISLVGMGITNHLK